MSAPARGEGEPLVGSRQGSCCARAEAKRGGRPVQPLAHIAVMLVTATAPAHHDQQRCRTSKCETRVALHHCSNRAPRWCVLYVIRRHRVQEPERGWLLRIPSCESTWRPELPPNRAGATGLYQFLPSTWAGTPYGRHSIYSARWQAEAAHWVYQRDGGGSEWVCS